MQAGHIIHTVGPAWVDGKHGEFDILSDCYENSLAKAVELQCDSISFPLIATGVYGFPKDRALQIAVSVISRFLLSHAAAPKGIDIEPDDIDVSDTVTFVWEIES